MTQSIYSDIIIRIGVRPNARSILILANAFLLGYNHRDFSLPNNEIVLQDYLIKVFIMQILPKIEVLGNSIGNRKNCSGGKRKRPLKQQV